MLLGTVALLLFPFFMASLLHRLCTKATQIRVWFQSTAWVLVSSREAVLKLTEPAVQSKFLRLYLLITFPLTECLFYF